MLNVLKEHTKFTLKTRFKKPVEVLDDICGKGKYLLGGPAAWPDAGQTTLHPNSVWVLNSLYSGIWSTPNRRYIFVITDFPSTPSPEFWWVDLVNNLEMVDISRGDVLSHIHSALTNKTIEKGKLLEVAMKYGCQFIINCLG